MTNGEPTKTLKKKKIKIIQDNIANYMLYMMKVIACLKPGVSLNINQQRESLDGCSLVSRKIGSTK